MKRTFLKTPLIAGTTILLSIITTTPFAAPNTDTGSVAVSAVVGNVCRIGTGGNAGTMALNFDIYDPSSASATDVSGTVTVHCTKNTSYTLTLGEGTNAASGSTCAAPSRQMSAGSTDRLAYAIYSNLGRTTVWGCDASNQVSGLDSDGPSTYTTHTLYGRATAGQNVAAGTYTDTVVVTVTY